MYDVLACRRFLSYYKKSHAGKPWSFQICRFTRQYFVTCHPLSLDQHASRQACILRGVGSLTSLVLNIIANGVYSLQRRKDVLNVLKKTKELEASDLRSDDIMIIYQKILQESPASPLIKPLKIICALEDELKKSPDSTIILQMFNQNYKSTLLDLYHKHLHRR